MKSLEKISPEIILRLGLGLMYIYSGLSLFSTPGDWQGFVPQWFLNIWNHLGPIDIFLKLQGLGELVLGLMLLAWFSGKKGLKIAALLASLEIFSIILFVGIDIVTFRDLGVFAAALSLTMLVWQPQTKALPDSPQNL